MEIYGPNKLGSHIPTDIIPVIHSINKTIITTYVNTVDIFLEQKYNEYFSILKKFYEDAGWIVNFSYNSDYDHDPAKMTLRKPE